MSISGSSSTSSALVARRAPGCAAPDLAQPRLVEVAQRRHLARRGARRRRRRAASPTPEPDHGRLHAVHRPVEVHHLVVAVLPVRALHARDDRRHEAGVRLGVDREVDLALVGLLAEVAEAVALRVGVEEVGHVLEVRGLVHVRVGVAEGGRRHSLPGVPGGVGARADVRDDVEASLPECLDAGVHEPLVEQRAVAGDAHERVELEALDHLRKRAATSASGPRWTSTPSSAHSSATGSSLGSIEVVTTTRSARSQRCRRSTWNWRVLRLPVERAQRLARQPDRGHARLGDDGDHAAP